MTDNASTAIPERRKAVWRDQFQSVPDTATLLACPACGAAVAFRDAQRHADWHNGSDRA